MSKIVDSLRDRAYANKARDPLCEEAAAIIEALEWRDKVRVNTIARQTAEIERLRELRKLDGESLGVSVAEYNAMKALCIDGKYLTDEEREAVEWCVEMATVHATDCDDELATLRKLLERLTA